MTNVFEAVQNVMRSIGAVGKDGENTYDNYNFRGIDGVMNSVGPVLREHRVIAVPVVDHAEYGTSVTSKGATMTTCRLKMIVRWYGPEGDFFESVTWGEAFDRGDKATAKAHSVAFRTAIIETLCLPTQEPDPDEFSYARDLRAEQAEAERAKVVRQWGALLSEAEKAGQIDRVEKAVEQAKKQGDQQLFDISNGVLQRMKNASQEVVEAEVVNE